MSTTPLAPYNWNIDPAHERANDAHLTTVIMTIAGDAAVMVTNSFSGIRIDQWHVWERHMSFVGQQVSTYLVWVGKADRHTDALNLARDYAYDLFKVDISAIQAPF